MATFTGSDDLRGAEFTGVDLRGARFVEAELNRRFPGRADRRAAAPAGLRSAWAAVERTWAATLERVAAMPITPSASHTPAPRTRAAWTCRSSARSRRRMPDVLEVRAGRVAMVRDYLAAVTPGELAETRQNPWDPEYRPA